MVRDLLTPMHLLLIVLAFIVLFGGKKLADVGKGLGEGIRNFKSSLKGDDQPTPPSEEKKQAEETKHV
jgi:sec-independent protein translocase protein TatA